MPRRLVTCCLVVMTAASRLVAQGDAQCAAALGARQNLCNAAVDGARVFTPELGILMSGGNPFMGSNGGLGRFLRTGFTVRVNVTNIVVPDARDDGTGTTVAARQKVLAPSPLIEGAVGVFRGVSHGYLALDALGSVQLLPTNLLDDVHIDVDATTIGSIAVGLGYGGRLTLVPEGSGLPAVLVTVMHRGIPRLGIGSIAEGDHFSFAADFGATNYRAIVAKRFGTLMLGGGVGWDIYSGEADAIYHATTDIIQQPAISVTLHDSRALAFADGGFVLGPAHLIAEVGLLRGKDLGTVTTFTGNDPKASRIFGSLGLRFRF